MTECEICGVEIKGKVQYITIGSSKLQVCKACARYGTGVVVDKKAKTTLGGEPVQLVKAKPLQGLRGRGAEPHKRRLYEQMDLVIEEEMGMGEEYGRKIKEAREKAGLKQAELAKRINEKQSLVRKIENEEIIPSKEVWGKIERVLKSFL
ncbi:MAG: multiprotein-bridging factor 1 family protein [archaeon]|nr:multiprotein-bridging factor 1 family protein [archaeon]